VTYRILLVVLVASTFWWLFRVKEGEREFRESQQALRQVTTWRQARIGFQDNEQAEIVCPDRGHWLRHATSQSAGAQTFESFDLGPKSYSRSQKNFPTGNRNMSHQ
jgi:hypothetical protein